MIASDSYKIHNKTARGLFAQFVKESAWACHGDANNRNDDDDVKTAYSPAPNYLLRTDRQLMSPAKLELTR